MRTRYTVEQVFISNKGNQLEFLFVLETLAGARYRDTMVFNTLNKQQAVKQAAKHLAYRGDIRGVSNVRLRLKSSMRDDPALQALFIKEFKKHMQDDE